MRLLASYWENLVKLVGPTNVLTEDITWKKDFGLHLKRLGFQEFESLIFPGVPIGFIGHIGDDLYTFGSTIHPDDADSYVVSFDFDLQVMQQLRGKIPESAYQILIEPLGQELRQVKFADDLFRVNLDLLPAGACDIGKGRTFHRRREDA